MSWSLTSTEVALLIGSVALNGIDTPDLKVLAVVAKIKANVEIIDLGNGTSNVAMSDLKIVSDDD